ncbi:MAG: beta-lactamase family protein [Vicinamibacteria bacterium]|nr:beta-lactamase family protein [Vicinamibacteria bacterium]
MNSRPCPLPRVLLPLLPALALALAAPATAAPRPAASGPATAIDAVLKAAYPADQPGAAAIVVKDGKVLFRKAYGMANLELGVPLQPEMVFRLGSITKQFTAVAILMLAEEGRLSLSDPVEKFLPGYPTHGHVITIEHLLTHSSGIQSYTGMPGWMEDRILADLKPLELIDGFKKEPMNFAPGEQFRYNNSAYVMLGAIIEKASGKSYEAFVQERIFGPLAMKGAHYGSNGPLIKGRVAGYSEHEGAVVNARYLSMTQPYSAGSLAASVDDLAAWDGALYSEKLLKQASLAKAWTPYATKDGKPTRYGYGWEIAELRGRRAIEHGGGIFGFSTHATRLPDDKVYVAVLANSDSPRTSPALVARKLAAIAVGDPFPEPVVVTLAPEVLRRHVGVYRIDGEATRTITVEGDKLYSQRSGGARLEILPTSETAFFYLGSLSRLEFEVDAAGRTTAMLFFADDAREPQRCERIADAAAERVVAKVDPSLYDLYAGRYELAPNFVLTVTREGDRLMTQATGQAKVEVFPAAETEFFLKVVDAQITFLRGSDGQVDRLILRQGGREMPARRLPEN